MSHDPTGILRQILIALIVWGLLVIANQDEENLSPKQLRRQLQADLQRAAMELGYRLALQGVELAFEQFHTIGIGSKPPLNELTSLR